MAAADPETHGRIQRTGAQVERIVGHLRADILSGEFDPGAVLRQEYLADKYRTSRMPVRDALRVLENEGLVELVHNKGAVVAALNADECREIYEIRGALESLALRLAIPELTNRQLEEAGAILNRAERAGLSDFGVLNTAFHAKLYEPCRRPRLLAEIAKLADLADRYLRVAAVQLDYVQRSHREHRALLQACYDRDDDAAVACLRDHIEAAGRALFDMLSDRLGAD